MKTLKQIFSEHEGKVVDKWASYIEEYEQLFASYRDEPIALLEIGVQNGGSLEIWDKYFSRAKAIVGCDIDPACRALQFASDRIHVVIGDASTEQCAHQIAAITPDFDVIIDDGSHVAKDVIRTFSRYFSTLKSNGLYIIEDLHCSYWSDCEGGLAYPYSAASFLKALTDILNCDHWGTSRQRREFLIKYSQRYVLDFDEDVLASIHSIIFLNSLCFIKKAQSDARGNALGSRRVMGREAQVTDVTLPLAGQNLVSPDQGREPWTRYAFSTEQHLIGHISDLERSGRESERQLGALSQSLSDCAAQFDALRRALAAREEELGAVKQTVAERDARIVALDHSLSVLSSEIAALRQALADREDEVAAVKQTVAEREARTVALDHSSSERSCEVAMLRQARAVLEAQVSSLKATISALRTSTSWQITAPLRAARRLSARLYYSRLGYPVALAWRAITTRSRAPLHDWRAERVIVRAEPFDKE